VPPHEAGFVHEFALTFSEPETIKPQAEPEQGTDMATKRKTSTRKSSTAKTTTPRKTSAKPAPATASRKAASAKAASAARATLDRAVKESAAKPAVKPVSTPDAAPTPAAASAPVSPPASGKAAEVSTPQGVTTPSVAVTKRALVERVAARAGLRKAQARPVVEAMLAELGEALDRKETLKLQPLGIMRVARVKDTGSADVLVCKLRRKKSEKGGGDPLAEAAE
jgi:hypothetical protein